MAFLVFFVFADIAFGGGGASSAHDFPIALTSYHDEGRALWERLAGRIEAEPMNLIAAIIFVCAIIHTFFAGYLHQVGVNIQKKHVQKLIDSGDIGKENRDVSFFGRLFHYLGEVEAIFGIWVLALIAALSIVKGWGVAKDYVGHQVNFTEPMFIVVVMAIASSRPILNISENILRFFASFGGKSPAAWWMTILTCAPILGSFITEPAAMTIAALLLGKQFYALKPGLRFRYATLGLLFVNISVGGTLTNFAAPPVLMVAGKWGWSSPHMFFNYGLKAVVGIVIANLIYYFIFRKEMKELSIKKIRDGEGGEVEVTSDDQSNLVPAWVTATHLLFLAWAVYMAHYPVFFIGGFLFFIGFMYTTEQHQNRLELKGPMLVGFFLAGLVIHGGLQGWWIEPVLLEMAEFPLMVTAVVLTSFNDNAAITYLSSLVPGFSDTLKYSVVAGAVVGGGLTVIANAPNPAGQSILSKFFPGKLINPLYLFAGALFPTFVMGCVFWLWR
jgi:hypothetical protein